ncbi:MAG TPA: hydrogenase nickel incorporation protein HypB [Anaerolineae bacterium]|nr:hydrogenase nickel incorporation protein HypB [Anaerolineae bacterium]
MTARRVPIVEKILNANDQIAKENEELLNRARVYSLNIMASPGAGKTSLILQTIQQISSQLKLAVIKGDTAPVTIDADKVSECGILAVQINTGGECHLDAPMVKNALEQLPLNKLDLIIIENVGNLICPAAFKLGTNINIVVASIPEGDDKPYKYPNIYRGIDALILNKIDLLPYIDFNLNYFRKGIQALNPHSQFFNISCKTGEGIETWSLWLMKQVHNFKNKNE